MRCAALALCALTLCLGGCADTGGRHGSDAGGDATVDGAPRDGAPGDGAAADGDATDGAADGGFDTGAADSGAADSGAADTGAADTGAADTGSGDTGTPDTGAADTGTPDTGTPDTGAADTGAADTGTPDTGTPDTGTPDTGASPCVSGATGNHAVRFRWLGSGAGSTAYVRYDANTLPDTSRWRVTANSRSIGYRPVFDDPFLAEGGLDMSGSVFIDVELSTSGLSRIRHVTLAIRGRSFNTTTPGSFTWMSFDGSGAAPRNLVSNSAPYEWYGADATGAFAPGNSGVLLRIEPGPASNSLIVANVELCFDAD